MTSPRGTADAKFCKDLFCLIFVDFHSVPGSVKNFVAFKVFQFNRKG